MRAEVQSQTRSRSISNLFQDSFIELRVVYFYSATEHFIYKSRSENRRSNVIGSDRRDGFWAI
jgi:hypothetical protein